MTTVQNVDGNVSTPPPAPPPKLTEKIVTDLLPWVRTPTGHHGWSSIDVSPCFSWARCRSASASSYTVGTFESRPTTGAGRWLNDTAAAATHAGERPLPVLWEMARSMIDAPGC